MSKNNLVKLIISLALPFVAGGIGSYFTFSEISTWYTSLNKPPFSPPNWIFGPVWSALYLLMGISLYLYWTKQTQRDKTNGFVYYFCQLALNSTWSIAFFGLHLPLFGVGVIIFLWILIHQMMREFRKFSMISYYLLLPYIAWVSFAGILNLGVFLLNR